MSNLNTQVIIEGSAVSVGTVIETSIRGVEVVYSNSGPSVVYTPGEGIDITNGVISVTNPFSSDEATKLGTVEVGADVTDSENVEDALNAGDGITISADGTSTITVTNPFTGASQAKLEGIEAGADVTDTENVVGALSAGANITIDTDGTISADNTGELYIAGEGLSLDSSDNSFSVDTPFTTDEKSKLAGVEANADVTDTTNVVAALTAGDNIQIDSTGNVSATDTTYTGGTGVTIDGGAINVDSPFTSSDEAKLDAIEDGADVTDTQNVVASLTAGNNITITPDGTISAADDTSTYLAGTGLSLDSDDNTFSVNDPYSSTEKTKLAGIETGADVTDTANVVGSLTAGPNITIGTDGTISATGGGGGGTDYTPGDGITISGTTISVTNVFEQSDEDKLDGIETGADVTDTQNVVGALTAGEHISIDADGTISAVSVEYTGGTGVSVDNNGVISIDNPFSDSDEAKLDAIEAGADITDTANVVGALTAGDNITISAAGVVSASDGLVTAGNGITVDGSSVSVTNPFTPTDEAKLDGIEASATADQTADEILSKVRTNTNFNNLADAHLPVFTDTQRTDAEINSAITKNTIDELNIDAFTVDGNSVGVSVPSDAVFTDTQLTAAEVNDAITKEAIDLLSVNAGSVDGFTVATDVPTAAVFTDTTYSEGEGLTLTGTVFSVTHPFSGDDSVKLDGIEEGADVTDTANVVSALTAGDNVTISQAGVIAATGVTYSDFEGTDGTNAGVAGLVPAPTSEDAGDFLRADGTWATPAGGGGGGADLTYDIAAFQNGDNADIRLTGSDASTDSITVIGGDNVTVTRTEAHSITIDASEAFTSAFEDKLSAIEALADVTDTENVVAALTAGTNITIESDGTINSTGGGGGGTDYIAGDGITISGETISVSNPFTDADETKLDGIADGADVTLDSISAGTGITISDAGVIASTGGSSDLSIAATGNYISVSTVNDVATVNVTEEYEVFGGKSDFIYSPDTVSGNSFTFEQHLLSFASTFGTDVVDFDANIRTGQSLQVTREEMLGGEVVSTFIENFTVLGIEADLDGVQIDALAPSNSTVFKVDETPLSYRYSFTVLNLTNSGGDFRSLDVEDFADVLRTDKTTGDVLTWDNDAGQWMAMAIPDSPAEEHQDWNNADLGNLGDGSQSYAYTTSNPPASERFVIEDLDDGTGYRLTFRRDDVDTKNLVSLKQFQIGYGSPISFATYDVSLTDFNEDAGVDVVYLSLVGRPLDGDDILAAPPANGTAVSISVSYNNYELPDLGDLTDVSSTAPTDGQALLWDDTNSEWAPGTVSSGGGATSLNDLTDVHVGFLDDGYVLRYNEDNSRFETHSVNDTLRVFGGVDVDQSTGFTVPQGTGQFAVAIGDDAQATQVSSIAIGSDSSSTGLGSMALGDASTASANSTTAVGRSTVASSPSATAVGDGAQASHEQSAAFGTSATSSGDNDIRLGGENAHITIDSKLAGTESFDNQLATVKYVKDHISDASRVVSDSVNGIQYLTRASEPQPWGDYLIDPYLPDGTTRQIATSIQFYDYSNENTNTFYPGTFQRTTTTVDQNGGSDLTDGTIPEYFEEQTDVQTGNNIGDTVGNDSTCLGWKYIGYQDAKVWMNSPVEVQTQLRWVNHDPNNASVFPPVVGMRMEFVRIKPTPFGANNVQYEMDGTGVKVLTATSNQTYQRTTRVDAGDTVAHDLNFTLPTQTIDDALTGVQDNDVFAFRYVVFFHGNEFASDVANETGISLDIYIENVGSINPQFGIEHVTVADGLTVESTGDLVYTDHVSDTSTVLIDNSDGVLTIPGDLALSDVEGGTGIRIDGDTIIADIGDGLQFSTANEVEIDIHSTGGLEVDTNGIAVKLPTNSGLTTSSSGLSVALATASGLSHDVNGALFIQTDPLINGALTASADGLAWAADLGDLDNVDTATKAPVEGQHLTYDATAAMWVPGDSAGKLSDLSDVTLSGTPTDGSILAYNSANSAWENVTLSGNHSFTAGDALTFNTDGTELDFTGGLDDLSDVSTSGAIDGDLATWNGTSLEFGSRSLGRFVKINSNDIGTQQAQAAGLDAIAIGEQSTATEVDSIAIGRSAIALDRDTVALGGGSRALHTAAVAIGASARVAASETDLGGIAIGYASLVSASRAIAIGDQTVPGGVSLSGRTTASANFAVAMGSEAVATSASALALGYEADAGGTSSVAVGHGADADAPDGVAVGHSASASGTNGVAVGASSSAGATDTTALGDGATASSTSGTAVGTSSAATQLNTTAMGQTSTASGVAATAYGQAATAGGSSSTAIGRNASSAGNNGTAVGNDASAAGANSTVVGEEAVASGVSSVSVGYKATATGTNSIAIGNGVSAIGDNRVQIGKGDSVVGYLGDNEILTVGNTPLKTTGTFSLSAGTGSINQRTSNTPGHLGTNSFKWERQGNVVTMEGSLGFGATGTNPTAGERMLLNIPASTLSEMGSPSSGVAPAGTVYLYDSDSSNFVGSSGHLAGVALIETTRLGFFIHTEWGSPEWDDAPLRFQMTFLVT